MFLVFICLSLLLLDVTNSQTFSLCDDALVTNCTVCPSGHHYASHFGECQCISCDLYCSEDNIDNYPTEFCACCLLEGTTTTQKTTTTKTTGSEEATTVSTVKPEISKVETGGTQVSIGEPSITADQAASFSGRDFIIIIIISSIGSFALVAVGAIAVYCIKKRKSKCLKEEDVENNGIKGNICCIAQFIFHRDHPKKNVTEKLNSGKQNESSATTVTGDQAENNGNRASISFYQAADSALDVGSHLGLLDEKQSEVSDS